MNWDAIGAIGEIAGAIGVIVSLLYLGGHVRANTMAARAAAYQVMGVEISNLWHDWSTDPEMADLLSRAFAGQDLTEGETVQFIYLYVSALRLYETTWRQVELGLLDAEHLQWFGWSQHITPDNLPLRELWPQMENNMSPDFASYIERELGLAP